MMMMQQPPSAAEKAAMRQEVSSNVRTFILYVVALRIGERTGRLKLIVFLLAHPIAHHSYTPPLPLYIVPLPEPNFRALLLRASRSQLAQSSVTALQLETANFCTLGHCDNLASRSLSCKSCPYACIPATTLLPPIWPTHPRPAVQPCWFAAGCIH